MRYLGFSEGKEGDLTYQANEIDFNNEKNMQTI